jgi:hypothetical protein
MNGANNQEETSPSSHDYSFPFLRNLDRALDYFVTGVGAILYKKFGVPIPEQVAYKEERKKIRQELDELDKFIQAYDKRNAYPMLEAKKVNAMGDTTLNPKQCQLDTELK